MGSVPKSGCTFTDPTKLLMMVAELGSTGTFEISIFHALLLLNGTNPPRLAPWPVVMTLQARLGFEPPVPPVPPVPELPPEDCETPEQAVSDSTRVIVQKSV